MARPSPRPRRRSLRFVAGLSVIMGAIAILLSAQTRPGARRPRFVPRRPSRTGDASGHIGRGRPGEPPSPEALEDGFEPHDARAGSIGVVMAIGVATIACSIIGLFILLAVFHARDADRPPLTAEQTAPLQPPGPPLQSDPQADLAALIKAEDTRLRTYGWLAPDHSRARIPIDRAMALVVGKPLDPAP